MDIFSAHNILTYWSMAIYKKQSNVLIDPEIEDFLKALAGETRRRILVSCMDGGEKTVNQIAEENNIDQSTASGHLSFMRRARLFASAKKGREVYYYPDRANIISMLERILLYLKNCC